MHQIDKRRAANIDFGTGRNGSRAMREKDETSHRRGQRSRESADREIKGIFGEEYRAELGADFTPPWWENPRG